MNNVTTPLLETLLSRSTEEQPEAVMESQLDEIDVVTPLAFVISENGKILWQNNPGIQSAVALSSRTSRHAQVVIFTILSMIGSIGNIFLISAIMNDDQLRKARNSLIVNVGLADLAVTIVVIPISIISLIFMDDNQDSPSSIVLKFQCFLIASAFLVSLLTMAIISIENYIWLNSSEQDYNRWFSPPRITDMILSSWLIGIAVSVLQTGFSSSSRESTKSFTGFEICVLVLLILLPICITFVAHFRILCESKEQTNDEQSQEAREAFNSDVSLITCNFISFLTFLVFWLPFAIVVVTQDAPNNAKSFYYSAWLGISKSCFHNLIYCITNRHFRSAYSKLFIYCCCKNSSPSLNQVRRMEDARPGTRIKFVPNYKTRSMTPDELVGSQLIGLGGWRMIRVQQEE